MAHDRAHRSGIVVKARSKARCVVALIVVACVATAAEHATTVEQIADTYRIAAEKIAEAVPDSVDAVAIDAVDDSLGFARIAVESALSNRGIRVRSDAADNVTVLSVATEKFGVRVSDTRRHMLVGQREAERRVEIELAAQLIIDDVMVWRHRASAETVEWVPVKELTGSAADERFPMGIPRDGTAFALETVVIMSSIIVLLYLFFTQ